MARMNPAVATRLMSEAADEIERLRRKSMDDGMMIDALRREVSEVREKLGRVHRVVCEASGHLAKTCKGEDKDVDAAASKIALAIRLGA